MDNFEWMDRPENFSQENFAHVADVKVEYVNGSRYVSSGDFQRRVKDIFDQVNRPADEFFCTVGEHIFRGVQSSSWMEWHVMVFKMNV